MRFLLKVSVSVELASEKRGEPGAVARRDERLAVAAWPFAAGVLKLIRDWLLGP